MSSRLVLDKVMHRPVVLAWLAGLAFMALAVGFGMDVDILDGQLYPPMRLASLVAFGVALLLQGAFVIYLGRKYFSVKTNWFYLVGAIVLALGCTIGLYAFPASFPIADSVTYGISLAQKTYYFFYGLLTFASLYVIVAYLPSFNDGIKSFDIYYLGVMGLGLFECIYSYVKEASAYGFFFTHGYFGAVLEGSVVNKNVYGMILLCALGASGYLYVRRHHWSFIVAFCFFYANILCSRCRTALVLATATVFVFFLWRFFVTLKKHPWRNSLCLAFALALVGTVVGLFLMKSHYTPGSWIQNFIGGWESKAEKGDLTIMARVEYWKTLLTLYPQYPVLFIFGAGEGNFGYFMNALAFKTNTPAFYFAHSGFFESFGRGGLLRALAESAFEIYLFVLIIRSYKRKEELATASLGAFLIFFGQSLDESTVYLSCALKSLAAIVMVAFPLLAKERQLANAASEETRRKALIAEQATPFQRPALSYATILHEAFFIFTPWFAFLAGVEAIRMTPHFPLYASELLFVGLYLLALILYVFIRGYKREPSPLTKTDLVPLLSQAGLYVVLVVISALVTHFVSSTGNFTTIGYLGIIVPLYYFLSYLFPSFLLGGLSDELAFMEEVVAYKGLVRGEKANLA